ncbi:hypothetical protein IQ07DRAFT_75412 [Pyrenochaeta sp. DS3sAY3a]|nr:hypothetical protein IQ07DRAFT_75412 [Pyrenochaeta sp. DS3sAY3a]
MSEKCTPGLEYCGWKLLQLGDYYTRITDQIRLRNQLVDESHVQSTLFLCTDSGDSDIDYVEFCGEKRCLDGASDSNSQSESDTCRISANSAVVLTSSLSSALPTFRILPSTASPSPTSLLPSFPATLPTPPPSRSMSHTSYITMAVGVGIGVTAFVVIVFAVGFCYLRRRRARDVREYVGETFRWEGVLWKRS